MGDITRILAAKERYEHIANNTKQVYDHWVKGGPFIISINLMDYVFRVIDG